MDKFLSKEGIQKKALCEKFMDEVNPTVSTSNHFHNLFEKSCMNILRHLISRTI